MLYLYNLARLIVFLETSHKRKWNNQINYKQHLNVCLHKNELHNMNVLLFKYDYCYGLAVVVTVPPTRPPEVCTGSQFRCNDGMCIPGDLKCDGTADCGDSSDEFLSVCSKSLLS